jgi:hypothetical protein
MAVKGLALSTDSLYLFAVRKLFESLCGFAMRNH